MRHPGLHAVPRGHREFPRMVLGPVVEAESRDHLVPSQGVVERRDGVHPAAQEDDDFHALRRGEPSWRASTRMPIPPRGQKSPIITALLGEVARTTSARMRLVIPSAKTAWFL